MALKTQTFNISLPSELVKRADKVAKQEYRSRSELIKEALRIYLSEKELWKGIFAYGEAKAQELGITDEEQVFDLIS